ncbi:hypothetical protein DER44DRAFT_833186 [Fusarium oxysporum]|uniref:Uncharacterized protein n=1 Tax=Fusarium oxysporum f. sp. cepae TaxID=396571 RepID=A0A3L6MV81_FUSOX|nr:hypothetical protein DER44DRAFT_833186 [Fusarium oxysporum]RKK08221.1 hypothetical protein BFJ65_g16881 [Fusarium oxysporum f. sp. cepae]RKK17250.1 hypothetical protein BFJ67_g17764 [Fusarium oxysporum f. sp. cepae]
MPGLRHEDMFKGEPWTSLPDHNTGIKAFRECLRELLGQIAEKQQSWRVLTSTSDRTTAAAVSTFADDNLRLVTEVVNMMDEFAVDFEVRAHTYFFETACRTILVSPQFVRSDFEDDEEEEIDEKPSTCFDLNLYPDLEAS